MRKDIAKVWVDALRSGKYEQGSDYLCKNGMHCCLGVLCELYINHTGDMKYSRVADGDDGDYDIVDYGGDIEVLPCEVMEWAEINTSTGKIYDDHAEFDFSSLAEMNDSGHSFNDLAKVIEDYWPSL